MVGMAGGLTAGLAIDILVVTLATDDVQVLATSVDWWVLMVLGAARSGRLCGHMMGRMGGTDRRQQFSGW